MNGPYGPYIRHGKTNAKLPKEVKPEAVTLQKALALLAEKARQAPKTAAQRGKGGKTAASDKPKRAPKKKTR